MKKVQSFAIKVLVIVVTLLISLTGCNSSSSASVVYLKEGHLYYNGKKITEQFLNDWYEENDRTVSEQDVKGAVKLSDDGKRIFYLEKYMTFSACTLYCKDGNGSEKEIAKKVTSYLISGDGKKVAYKNFDDALYLYDFKDTQKISDNIIMFRLSKDGNRLLYVTKDYKLYIKDKDSKANLINDNIYKNNVSQAVFSDDENLTTVFFFEERPETDYDNPPEKIEYGYSLFACKDGKTAKRISKNANSTMSFWSFETGELYFLAIDDIEYYEYSDCIVNDMGEAGAEKYNRYSQSGTNVSYSSLWYYNGKDAKKIASNVSVVGSDVLQGKAVIAYYQNEKLPVKEVLLSTITDGQNMDEYIRSYLNSFVNLSMVRDGKASVITEEQKDYYAMTDDAVYFKEAGNGGKKGTVEKYSLKNGRADKLLYSVDNVYSSSMINDKLVYLKDYDRISGKLYIEEKLIADNVYSFDTYTDADGKDHMYCRTDYDKEKGTSTLKVYSEGKLITVAENSYYSNIKVFGSDLVYIIEEEPTAESTGDLYVYSNGKTKKIDSDVSFIIGG